MRCNCDAAFCGQSTNACRLAFCGPRLHRWFLLQVSTKSAVGWACLVLANKTACAMLSDVHVFSEILSFFDAVTDVNRGE
jgi:hypothetical protein